MTAPSIAIIFDWGGGFSIELYNSNLIKETKQTYQHRLSQMLVEKMTQRIIALCRGISPPLESDNGKTKPAQVSIYHFFWGGGGGGGGGGSRGNDIQTFETSAFLLFCHRNQQHGGKLCCMRRGAQRNSTTQILPC